MSINSRKTPYYLLDLEKVKANFLSFQNSIKSVGRNDIIAYSVKANYNPAIIELVKKLGGFFEVCSDYEYNLMQGHNIPASHIIVNGCFYNDFSKYKDSIIIIDSFEQLLEWADKGSKVTIGIRVNLDHMTVDDRFRNKKSRFGLRVHTRRVKELLKKVNTKNIICLHCHLSGNNREPSIYRDIISQLQKICKEFQLDNIKFLDIGGGYKIGSEDGFWSFDDYVKKVVSVGRQDVQIIFEPGNSLVRNCAEYHTKVIAVKETGDENIFVVDGSSLHLPKSIPQNLEYHFDHLNKQTKYSGQLIYGNTCKESDLMLTLNSNEMISVGDYLIIKNIGAYSLNEVSQFILGMPNLYLKTNDQITIGNHLFNFVCKYSDCYNKNGENDYSIIRQRNFENGLYAFVCNGIVIYIGVAYSRNITERVVQHFRKDSGGIRKKLSQDQIKELEQTSLYVCQLNGNKQSLLFEEALLIGLCRPKLNFYNHRP